MPKMVAVPINVPADVAKRLRELAPTSAEQSRLLLNFVLEGLNRHELDCLWCRLKAKTNGKAS